MNGPTSDGALCTRPAPRASRPHLVGCRVCGGHAWALLTHIPGQPACLPAGPLATAGSSGSAPPEARPTPPCPQFVPSENTTALTADPSQAGHWLLCRTFPCRGTLFICFAITVTGLSFLIVFHWTLLPPVFSHDSAFPGHPTADVSPQVRHLRLCQFSSSVDRAEHLSRMIRLEA